MPRTPYVRSKSEIYTPKRDEEHPHPSHMRNSSPERRCKNYCYFTAEYLSRKTCYCLVLPQALWSHARKACSRCNEWSVRGLKKSGPVFLWFTSSMCSFMACCISDRRSRAQIGFDQFAPSACQQEIWDTRLLSQKGVDVTSSAQFAALPLFDKDFELHAIVTVVELISCPDLSSTRDLGTR